MASQQQFICEVCGSDQFFVNADGVLVCEDCGTASTGFREEVADVLMPGVSMRGYRSSQPQSASQFSQAKDDNVTIRSQAKEDTYLSAEESLVAAMAVLCSLQVNWAREHEGVSGYVLKISKLLLERWVTFTGQHSRAKASTITTLGIMYLACVTCREAVLPTDIECWTRKRAFPYGLATREALAKFDRWPAVHRLTRAENFPSAAEIRRVAQKVASTMEGVPNIYEPTAIRSIPDLPVGNPVLALRRFIRQLNLSDEAFTKAMQLRSCRLKSIQTLTGDSSPEIVNFICASRTPPYFSCTELELMADVLTAAELTDYKLRPRLEAAALARLEDDLSDQEIPYVRGKKLLGYVSWCDEVALSHDSLSMQPFAKSIESIARKVADMTSSKGRLQYLRPDPSGNLPPPTFLQLALGILRLGINGAEEIKIMTNYLSIHARLYSGST